MRGNLFPRAPCGRFLAALEKNVDARARVDKRSDREVSNTLPFSSAFCLAMTALAFSTRYCNKQARFIEFLAVNALHEVNPAMNTLRYGYRRQAPGFQAVWEFGRIYR